MGYKIYNADCLEIIKQLPDKSVDLVLTGPPYMMTDIRFDKDGVTGQWFRDCLRIVKDNGYLVSFGSMRQLVEISNVWNERWTGIWLKPCGAMRVKFAKKPMGRQEPYGVFSNPLCNIKDLVWNPIKIEGKPYRKTMRKTGYLRERSDQIDIANASAWTTEGYVYENEGYRWQTDVIEANAKQRMVKSERTAHPTQKPVKVMATFIQWLTNENMIVFDPFMGSGTTGVACLENNREFIGVEINADYFEIARKRLVDKEMEMNGKLL